MKDGGRREEERVTVKEKGRGKERRKRAGFDGNDESLILISLQFALKCPR